MRNSIMAKTDLDGKIAELVGKTSHKTLVIWACDCAKRVLPYFEKKYPNDKRPRLAIEAGRTWVRTGVFRMADVRQTSLAAHAAAREAENGNPARSAARAAGQAIAATHVRTHSIAAAIYATTVRRDDAKPANAALAAKKERTWQYQHLLDLRDKHQKPDNIGQLII